MEPAQESPCLDDETIAALISATVSPALLGEVEAHVSRCAHCQELVADAAYGAWTDADAASGAVGKGDQSGPQLSWQHALARLCAPARAMASTLRGTAAPGNSQSAAARISTGSDSDPGAFARLRFATGALLAQRFRILRFIARGGMGEVFEAEDQVLGTRVALKTFAVEGHAEKDAIARFRREVALARTITHPNVCRVFDVGLHVDEPSASQVLFMTMELLAGETLSARIAKAGRLSPELALPIAKDICAGLAAAHQAGIIHRDFKGSNVVLHVAGDGTTRAVVTDFGLARLREGEASLTREGQLLGTPATMAPEQVLGEKVTLATDIYALGCVLFEMLTGTLPFVGNTPFASANLRLTQRAPSLRSRSSDAPRHWEPVVARCLERRPEQRFQDAQEVVAALTRDSTGGLPRRKLALLLASTVVAGALVVGHRQLGSAASGIGSYLRSRSTKTATAPPAQEQVLALRAGPASVAVLPLRNLAQRSEQDWLATALREMLSTELATSERLRLVPGDSVVRSLRDLRAAGDALPSAAALGRVRALTSADWVLDGAYLLVSNGETENLRIDLSLVDAASGDTLASVSSTGTTKELFELIARAGAELRDRLGLPPADPAGESAARAASARDPGAERAYAEGLALGRAFDLEAASERFLRVIEIAPDYPLGHSELANVYRLMGKDDLARKEAARALSSSQNLSREAQLLLEARAHAASQEWQRAADAYDTLFRFYPSNLSYGIQLARMVVNDGRPKDALEVIARLRKLPRPASDNPEIDLVEGIIASKASDYTRVGAVAKAALQKGEAAGSKSVVADAKSLLGEAQYHLGDPAAALAYRLEARQLFFDLGDQRGVARSLDALGDLYFDSGDLAKTLSTKEEALSIARAIGHQYRVGGLLNSIGEVQQALGNIPAARQSYEAARTTYLAMNEREGVGHTLANIASTLLEQGAFAEAKALYEKALDIHVAVGARIGEGYEHIELARVAHATGDLKEAREQCATGRAIIEPLQDRETMAEGWQASSAIAEDEGNFEAARADATLALEAYRKLGYVRRQADVELRLVRLAIDTGDFSGAEQLASSISAGSATSAAQRALAVALRARALGALGRATQAQAAATLADSLAKSLWVWADQNELALAVAEQQARTGERQAALQTARSVLAEAETKGHLGLGLDARLLLVRLTPRDLAARRQLLDVARAKHYGRIPRLLAQRPNARL